MNRLVVTWFSNWSTWLTPSARWKVPVSPRGNGHLFLKAVVTRRPYPYWLIGWWVDRLMGWSVEWVFPTFLCWSPVSLFRPTSTAIDQQLELQSTVGDRGVGSAAPPGGVEGANRGMVGGTRRKLLWFLLATFHTRSTFGWLRERSTQRSELTN